MIRSSQPVTSSPVIVEQTAALALPADFLQLSGTGRLNAILNLPKPDKVLKRLREDEFSYLVNSIGIDDAGCLIQYATPGQRRVFVDMGVWSGTDFAPDRLDRILDVARDVGFEFSVAMLKELDPELVVLSVAGRALVYTVEEAEDIEFEPGTGFMTPDNVFLLVCKSADEVTAVRNQVDLMYAVSVAFAHRMLQAGRWETVSSLEEHALEYRRSRLADNGFPEDENVFDLFEPFDFEGFRTRVLSDEESVDFSTAGLTPGEPLALTVGNTSDSLFFWKVVGAAGHELNTGLILSQTLNLVNRVLAARVKDLSDTEAWEAIAAHSLFVVSVGLEAVSGGDIPAALKVMKRSVPLELYRAGTEFTRPASIMARQVIADVGGMSGLSMFGDFRAADIDAAAAFPPMCPPSISGGSARDFMSCLEVTQAVSLMKKYKAVVQFAKGVLGFDPAKASGEGSPAESTAIVRPTFSNVVATAWARQILGGGLSIAPLNVAEVKKLRATAFDGELIKPSLRVSTQAEDEYSVAVREFLNEALDRVEQSIGGIEVSSGIKLKFVGDSLLVTG